VHCGDNPTAFTLYPNDRWRCWTNGCHGHAPDNCLGLVRAVLSAREGREVGAVEAARWAEGFLGGQVAPLPPAAPGAAFVKAMGRLTPPREEDGIPVEEVRRWLVTPSPYFLGRGFAPAVLEEFLVGEPRAEPKARALRGRALAPVLNGEGTRVVGFSGRVTGEREWDDATPKWRHHGFHSGRHLYGLGRAQPGIRATQRVVLVEGPGDVWACRAAGVPDVVGLFGQTLKDGQQFLLEQSGALEVVVATDNDEAGEKGYATVLSRLSRLFNVRRCRPPEKDWAATPPDDIKRRLGL
jgi:5S rRNA maturation endonuclease (ribonuclease M5)